MWVFMNITVVLMQDKMHKEVQHTDDDVFNARGEMSCRLMHKGHVAPIKHALLQDMSFKGRKNIQNLIDPVSRISFTSSFNIYLA